MTSRITQDPGKGELGFPKLMVSTDKDNASGMVVLFVDEKTGTVLFLGNAKTFVIGEYWSAFDWSCFEPFHGTVELRNE